MVPLKNLNAVKSDRAFRTRNDPLETSDPSSLPLGPLAI